jgi:hypothetical protein
MAPPLVFIGALKTLLVEGSWSFSILNHHSVGQPLTAHTYVDTLLFDQNVHSAKLAMIKDDADDRIPSVYMYARIHKELEQVNYFILI